MIEPTDVTPTGFSEASTTVEIATLRIRAWVAGRLQKLLIGKIVTYSAMLGFLIVVVVSAYLAITGRQANIGPFVQSIQPFLLPLLGAIAGYAFGHEANATRGDEEA